MIVFVSVFFSLGCVSVVYMRKCLTQALGIDDGLRSGDRGNWLSERQGACGLDASVIETFPTFRYSTISGLARESGQNSPRTLISDDNRRRVLGSPDERLIDSVAWSGKKSMPRKSMSTGWKLAGLFSRSSSTGQMRENLDRFKLRLPQEIHDQLVNQESKGHIALPQVRSSIRGYRTGSLGNERNYFYFEQFDQDGRLHRRPFSITPPYCTGSFQSLDIHGAQEPAGPHKGLIEANQQ
ncbi:BnaA07g10430D [Brassica napus]|uniref:BnaA07g10430D protein n=1 Tax=Brassica napus TaxID=3708 RepID=A0A078GKE5_BRANA|nr:BnaA07g10430D [Brassica napus]